MYYNLGYICKMVFIVKIICNKRHLLFVFSCNYEICILAEFEAIRHKVKTNM